MTFKSTLALVLLLAGTQSMAASYNCSLETVIGKTKNHSELSIETSTNSVTVVSNDSRLATIDQTFFRVPTQNEADVLVFAGWTESKYVTILLPSYALSSSATNDFTMELGLQAIPGETAIDSAAYVCTKR